MRPAAITVGLTVCLVVVTSAAVGAATPTALSTPKVRVVAAFYPLAYAAQRVGGRLVTVTNLTPPGAEPHDLELTPKQRDAIDDAGVVLLMGSGFQPSVEQAAQTRRTGTVELLKQLPIGAQDKKVAKEGRESEPDVLDPHVWLDPNLMSDLVGRVAAALGKASPEHTALFETNATAFRQELAQLDSRYRQGLAMCDRTVIVTSHEAFGYLAKAYGLHQEGIAGLSPDAEPSAKRLAQLTDLVHRLGVTTIFTEELVSPRIAQTLAREAGGLKTDVLNPLEGLTTKEVKARDTYLTVMDRNLTKLRAALGCR